jgi:hypothetical protein
VYFNATEPSLVNTAVGEYGFQTFVHEIGHALGLNHMGDYNGDGNWSPSSYQDSVVLSVMSYFGPAQRGAQLLTRRWHAGRLGGRTNGTTYSPQTPMVNDVMAIQAIYGASTTTRSWTTPSTAFPAPWAAPRQPSTTSRQPLPGADAVRQRRHRHAGPQRLEHAQPRRPACRARIRRPTR